MTTENSRADALTGQHVHALMMAQTASCTCLTKTPEPQYHDATCRYRLLAEVIDFIEHRSSQPAAAPKFDKQKMLASAREHGMDLGDNPVAYEFYNKETGHAIVDYTRWTHRGHLTEKDGYEARPLVYAHAERAQPAAAPIDDVEATLCEKCNCWVRPSDDCSVCRPKQPAPSLADERAANESGGIGHTRQISETARERIAQLKRIDSWAHTGAIGCIEADELEKLGSPEFADVPENHVRLWHPANPPSRALIPVFARAASANETADERAALLREAIGLLYRVRHVHTGQSRDPAIVQQAVKDFLVLHGDMPARVVSPSTPADEQVALTASEALDAAVEREIDAAVAESFRPDVPYLDAWVAICRTLWGAVPDWDNGSGTGIEKACAAIQRLIARAASATKPADERAAFEAYVECRQCDECGHVGINDSHPTDAACGYSCGYTGPSPAEDKCPGCGQENVMSVACPKCSGRYSLLAGETVRASSANETGAEAVTIPAGYVLVPIERSYDMRVKAILAFNAAEKDGKDRDDALDAAHQAMIAAAPQPSQADARVWLTDRFIAEFGHRLATLLKIDAFDIADRDAQILALLQGANHGR
ncbi:hypothetical protein K6W26_22895 [Burkholderia sp. AU42008]|uniref:hypothetical protein n=1 Tax=unclassified Burkholderia TaxID=2613784 RepID=UPI001177A0EA|nr:MULTISPECIES: hypothetical protein [unclassified Burkholderia]MBR8234653.1 hypothetical protein [Burkholderia sp. AU32357]MBY4875904.1 hypothetical protein [Burkholderia sp. AU42008]